MADNLKLASIQAQVDVRCALEAARRLVLMGVPVLTAGPALDKSGGWLSEGGTGGTGYWLPRGWHRAGPDLTVLALWRPGMALVAVMGRGVDLLDVDPRHRGDVARQALMAEGQWPEVICQAATPSGGFHDFVASLGVRSRDAVLPGLDVKAGIDGAGHGLAFIAPTVRRSKETGRLEPYRWLVAPTGRLPVARGSNGVGVRGLVEAPRLERGSAAISISALRGQEDRRLAELPDETPCAAMRRQLDKIAKELANGSRHAAILGPVLQLVRLAAEGHAGLASALGQIRADFVSRVTDRRGGGQFEAVDEWCRAVNGAVERVLGGGGFPDEAACECWLADLARLATDPSLFSRGVAGQTERLVMGHLIGAARRRRSRVVCESQRQIAEAIDVRQPTVSNVLSRLANRGWLVRDRSAHLLDPAPVRLLMPTCAAVSTNGPAEAGLPTAGLLVDTPLHTRVHRLLGPQGLGPGAAETLAALPEQRGPVLDQRAAALPRGCLVQVRPGSPSTSLLCNPQQGERRIPKPAAGEGRTVQQLVEVVRVHRTTALRRLRKLERWGLVITAPGEDGAERWWRLRFDPDVVADQAGVPHTAELKAERHRRQRVNRLEWLARAGCGVEVENVDGRRVYRDAATGRPIASTD